MNKTQTSINTTMSYSYKLVSTKSYMTTNMSS